MPAVLVGIGALLAVLIAASRAHARGAIAPATAAVPPVDPNLKKIVASGNPKAIAQAAIAVHKAGNPTLAAALAKRAKGLAVTGADASYKSPFPGVADVAWSTFVHAIRGADPKAITPAYFLGMFGFGMRRLVDLGLATNPHRGDFKGKQVWLADWIPSLQPGPDKFLSDPDLQYRTFAKSMLAYGKQIAREMPEAVGSTLDGQTVTLSGLLAVAKQAGFDGLKTWAASEEARTRYRTTTEQFEKLNGVF